MKLSEIRDKVIVMACGVSDMAELCERGFTEHKKEFLNKAMAIEQMLNNSEKSITQAIFDAGPSFATDADRKEAAIYQQAIETLERMGDEGVNLVERIEIKIAEGLLFSEIGVEQFIETYDIMKRSLKMLCDFLKHPDPELREKIVDNGFVVKGLIERYRKEHSERLVKGLCCPMGANMYFDMLEFTGNLARHASNIAKLF
jgi:Na+/phosphate symporter